MLNRRDPVVLVAARGVRGFGAGALSIVFALDLLRAGFSELWTGAFVGLAMGFGAAWSIAAPRIESRLGRRTWLLVGALLFAAGGALLWLDVSSGWVVLLALALGGTVTGASDISPLGATEQAAMGSVTAFEDRTLWFAVYNLSGYLGAAFGAVAAVPLSAVFVSGAWVPSTAGDLALALYGLLGVALLPVYASLGPATDAGVGARHAPLGPESTRPVLQLTALFSVDAFGGGLIANSLVTAFLVARFHPSLESVGLLLFGGNVAAGVSLLLAVPLARKIGLVPTMVFTHLPSDVLLAAVAFAPSLAVTAALWIGRSTLSQMDVPTRQAYVQSIVRPEERTAAAGYTTAARSGQAFGAPTTGVFLGLAGPWLGAPFLLAGSLKVVYDLALYRLFRDRSGPPSPTG